MGCLGGSTGTTRILIRGTGVREGSVLRKAEIRVVRFDNRRRGHKATGVSNLWLAGHRQPRRAVNVAQQKSYIYLKDEISLCV